VEAAVTDDLTLTNTVILAVVAPTPSQLEEARKGILARGDELDREFIASEVQS
jgi:hypothetical protein